MVLFTHSLQLSTLCVSDSLQPHGLQHTRLPCPSLSPRVCSNSCPFSQWCHPAIASSVIPFSSCPQSFPESGSFPMSWLFEPGGQSIGASASASVLPTDIHPLKTSLTLPTFKVQILILSQHEWGQDDGKTRLSKVLFFQDIKLCAGV